MKRFFRYFIVQSGIFKRSISRAVLVHMCLLPITIFGQCVTQTIEVDESSGFKRNLPFDESFRVKISGSSVRNVHNAFLYYHTDGGLQQLETSNSNNSLDKFYSGKSMFLEVPGLEPQKDVVIGVTYKPHGQWLKVLLDINVSALKGDSSRAQVRYDSLYRESVAKVGSAYRTYLGYDWDMYRKYFNITLKPEYTSLNTPSITAGTFVYFNQNNFDTVAIKFASKNIPTGLITTLGLISSLGNLSKLETGSIEFAAYSPVRNVDNVERRIDNLKNTQKQLITLLNQLERYHYLDPNEPITFALKAEVELLNNLITLSIVKHQNVIRSVKQKIRQNTNLYFGGFYYGTNSFSDLKTEGSYRIIPTIGLAFVPAFGRGDFELFTLTYAGATIYLRPVNKHLGRNCHNWAFKQRFSVNIGVTLNNIESSEFQDFYKGTSILVGGHYKITRIISLTVGGVLMKQTNENPIIDNPHTVVRPYAGLSLDLDIASLFKRVNTKLF